MRLVFWIAFAAVAAVAAVTLGRDDEPDREVRAAAPAPAPLLAIDGLRDAETVLVRLRPATLKRVGEPIPIHDWLWSSAWAPDRRRIALSADGAIQVVDTKRWRRTATIRLDRRAYRIAWPTPRRILALGGQHRGGHTVLVIDPVARRVVQRLEVAGQEIGDGFRPTAAGFAMLVGPPDRIGPATLALVSADGGVRRVPLEGIRGGFESPDFEEDPYRPGRQHVPGLAIDEAGERLYVVSADDGAVVAVSARDGTAVRHEPAERRTALARLRDLLDPPAEAKGSYGPWRTAVMIGHVLAVTGHDAKRAHRVEPAGLTLIDTRAWTAEKVGDDLSTVQVAGGAFIAGEDVAGGLVALDPDGSKRFEVMPGRSAWVQAAGERLYADAAGPSRTHVIDAGTGRVIRRLPPGDAPVLIPPPFR